MLKFLVNNRYIYAEFEQLIPNDFGKRDCSFAEIIDIQKQTITTISRNSIKKLIVKIKDISEDEIKHLYLEDRILQKIQVNSDRTFRNKKLNVDVVFINKDSNIYFYFVDTRKILEKTRSG